jgi:hypothetical protein
MQAARTFDFQLNVSSPPGYELEPEREEGNAARI